MFSYLGTDLLYASLEVINAGSVVSKSESDKRGCGLLANGWWERVYLADVAIWVSRSNDNVQVNTEAVDCLSHLRKQDRSGR